GDRVVFFDAHRALNHRHTRVDVHLAADAALHAGRRRAVVVPGARLETIGLRGERADRAELRDVTAEIGVIRLAGGGRDDRVNTAVVGAQGLLAGDDLIEPHAAQTEHTALFVEHDRRRA